MIVAYTGSLQRSAVDLLRHSPKGWVKGLVGFVCCIFCRSGYGIRSWDVSFVRLHIYLCQTPEEVAGHAPPLAEALQPPESTLPTGYFKFPRDSISYW